MFVQGLEVGFKPKQHNSWPLGCQPLFLLPLSVDSPLVFHSAPPQDRHMLQSSVPFDCDQCPDCLGLLWNPRAWSTLANVSQ